jgi:hypothetical protein
MGALPVATCKSSAVEPVAVEGLETCRAGPPPTVPVSLVIAVAVLFREPRMKLPPLAPKALVATPKMSPNMMATPTTTVVALAIHTTLLTALLTISISSP